MQRTEEQGGGAEGGCPADTAVPPPCPLPDPLPPAAWGWLRGRRGQRGAPRGCAQVARSWPSRRARLLPRLSAGCGSAGASDRRGLPGAAPVPPSTLTCRGEGAMEGQAGGWGVLAGRQARGGVFVGKETRALPPTPPFPKYFPFIKVLILFLLLLFLLLCIQGKV